MSVGWIGRANQADRPQEPPRSGRGATKTAWREHAEALGYTVRSGAGRDEIIAQVDAGPPSAQAPVTLDGLGPVAAATERAIEAADHLTDADAGALEVLRDLARAIDGMSDRRRGHLDNVTKPTYLKYAAELGLTPMSRNRLDKKEKPRGTKLGELRSIAGGKA